TLDGGAEWTGSDGARREELTDQPRSGESTGQNGGDQLARSRLRPPRTPGTLIPPSASPYLQLEAAPNEPALADDAF
ncbi:hypothetical protein, partial [Arthrobacter sp. BF1]|uniref:hypothetical protein n=1 Tax=Arthrobacter sp. BF1 TaxID=2821145 RepID=UPI001C502190